MKSVKKSFLSNLIGSNIYDYLKYECRAVLLVSTCILIVLYGLTCVCHFEFISSVLNGCSGYSLLFLAYILAVIVRLDIEVNENEPEYFEQPSKNDKSFKYKLTIVWGVVLVGLGLLVMYCTNLYRKQYAFECHTFLVDRQNNIYHLDFNDDCEMAERADDLEEMYGYELSEDFTFCDWCDEYKESLEIEYESNQYFRR